MRIGMLVFAVLLAVLASLSFVFPAAAAAVCPSCYGFVDVGGDVFVQRDMPPQDLEIAREDIEKARARVGAFFGTLESHPRILLCQTEACYRPLGGGSRGITVLDRALILSPRGIATVIMSHELAHAELHRRIGTAAVLFRSIPQWFDEGLAVWISGDPRYLAPAGQSDRCKSEPDGELPTARAAWIENAQSAGLYAKAACKVSRWLDQHGGRDGVLRLADRITAGTAFDRLAN